MLQKRAISALFFLPPLITSIYFGSPWFSLLVVVSALLGFWEFKKLSQKGGFSPSLVCGFLSILAILYLAHRGGGYTAPLLSGIVVFSLIWILLRALVFRFPMERAFVDWLWTVGGIFYLGWLLRFWILIRLSLGWEWTLLGILATFSVDTVAYFTGSAWGRHTLAPKVSSGKTCEGTIGGFVGGIAVIFLLSFIASLSPHFSLSNPELWQITVLGIIIGIFAQLGDLAESMLKRGVRTKEAGRLIPGHGGVLDRLDSLAFTGVSMYYYLHLTIP